ncbi:Serine/threonine-protein phosphatase 4 regulatory subunit [Trichinella spiralis]|uniref:Serine/threonine-protein phosphatase 4 regulatory subunit n=1 Tax=Trichinella spiralis TaxID=6334 RepID=A0ABR3K126_TRISP
MNSRRVLGIPYPVWVRLSRPTSSLIPLKTEKRRKRLALSRIGVTHAQQQQQQQQGIYCIHCASPKLAIRQENLLHAMEQLMNLRQTFYPDHVEHKDCASLKNLSSGTFQQQHCHYPFCYSITFNDHSGGMPLVIRGCAESFLPPQPLKNHTKEYCRRIQENLDIVECVCPNSEYCGKSSDNQ